jgi:hypothetical protein
MNGGAPVKDPQGRPISVPVPAGDIRVMAADHDSVWIGLVANGVWSDWNLASLETSPLQMTNALRQGGLVRWDRRTGTSRFYFTADGLPHPWVSALATSANGLWVGTLNGGVGRLDPQTGIWTVWTETNGLPMNSVQSLFTTENELWVGFGRLDRGTVGRFDFGRREWRVLLPGDFPAQTNLPPPHLAKLPNVPPELKVPRIISHVPVSPVTAITLIGGQLWCSAPSPQHGSANNGPNFIPRGLLVCDLKTNGWYQALPDAPGSIARAGDRVWCSLGKGGLAHCDLRGGDWQRITRAEGLPFPPAALCEWKGRLLIAGEQFMVLDPARKQFLIYPFPTPGGAKLMTVVDDCVYLVRGSQILSLNLDSLQ